MKSKWLVTSSVLALGMIFSVLVAAQDQGAARGNLSGLVYDSTKALVPGAQVTITGPIGSLTQTTTPEGSFLFSTLIPGSYSVKVQKAGFKVASAKSADASPGLSRVVSALVAAWSVAVAPSALNAARRSASASTNPV